MAILSKQERPGIWGPPPQAYANPNPPKKPGYLDRLLGLYGSDPSSHIPEDQKGKARGAALMSAGINVLDNAGVGFNAQTPAQAIGNALQGAQVGAARFGAQQQAAQTQAKLRQLAESGATVPQLTAMMQELIAAGGPENLQAAQTLAQIISSRSGAKDSPYKSVPSGGALFNEETGEFEYPDQSRMPASGGQKPSLRQVYDPASKQYVYESYDPNTGVWTPTGKVARAEATGQPTELERRANFMGPGAREAAKVIDEFENGEGAPTRLQQLAEYTSLNEAQSPGAQQLYTAGKILGDAYLRLTSGAAIKDEEVDMFVRSFLPYPGDDDATRALKRRMRGHILRGMEILSQRVNQGPMFSSSTDALANMDQVAEIGAQAAEENMPPLDLSID